MATKERSSKSNSAAAAAAAAAAEASLSDFAGKSDKDVRKIFLEQLARYVESEEDRQVIEKSIYDYTAQQAKVKGILEDIQNRFFKRIYVNKCYTLLLNMDPEKFVHNHKFVEMIRNHEFDLSQIAYLSPQEIHKEHWKKYIDKQTANEEFIYNKVVGIRTTFYTCSRCKKNDCSYYQLQVRCNDEPATTFVNCLNCGHKWSG
jgi:DNA-directed RNA polymerase subunit M/transcription elongation factor TFIIS